MVFGLLFVLASGGITAQFLSPRYDSYASGEVQKYALQEFYKTRIFYTDSAINGMKQTLAAVRRSLSDSGRAVNAVLQKYLNTWEATQAFLKEPDYKEHIDAKKQIIQLTMNDSLLPLEWQKRIYYDQIYLALRIMKLDTIPFLFNKFTGYLTKHPECEKCLEDLVNLQAQVIKQTSYYWDAKGYTSNKINVVPKDTLHLYSNRYQVDTLTAEIATAYFSDITEVSSAKYATDLIWLTPQFKHVTKPAADIIVQNINALAGIPNLFEVKDLIAMAIKQVPVNEKMVKLYAAWNERSYLITFLIQNSYEKVEDQSKGANRAWLTTLGYLVLIIVVVAVLYTVYKRSMNRRTYSGQ
jgi:hypothetical protein